MNRKDFVKLIGAETGNGEYIPVACFLRSGYGCAGYYNVALNADLTDTCVLLNAHLVEFRESRNTAQRATIQDFNEFLEEIVMTYYKSSPDSTLMLSESDVYGKSIPITAIAYDEIVVMYPVARIGALMRRAEEEQKTVPSFLDIQHRSVIVKLLRTKLW